MLPAQGRHRFPSQYSFRQRGTSPWEIWYIIGSGNQTALVTVSSPLFDNQSALWGVEPGGVVDRLSVEVTTLAASSVFRAGLYAPTSNANIYPSALYGETGELSGATTGVKTATVSIPIPAGLICASINPGVASPTYRAIPVGGQTHLAGLPSTMGANGQNMLNVARSYAALGTFPSGAAFVAVNSSVPAVAVRYAS
jgi:hypothetical protein